MSAIETVQAVVAEAMAAALPAGGPLLVAVSGGADSLCLLHALHALAPELRLRLQVAHLDHGLRAAAADDAAWVAALCGRWGLPCHLGRADVRSLAAAEGRSLEDAARQARYRFLAPVAAEAGAAAVAVGHTADDQAETVLLHLIRGAGLDGLAGMACASPWPLADDPRGAALTVLRPLLAVARAQTTAYCAALGLAPRRDESNDASVYTRNRLRLELLPLLRELNPAVVAALGRTAEIVRGEAALLQPLEDDAWQRLARVDGPSVRLERAALALEPVALQRRLLRRAVGALADRSELSWEHIAAALRVVQQGRTGACAELPHGLRLRVDYDWLWVEPRDAPRASSRWPAVSAPCRLDIPGEAALANGWRLRARVAPRAALPADWASTVRPLTAYLDAQALGPRAWLRPRRPGDRLQPLGMAGRQKVSDLLINARVSAACRDALPLLMVGDEIAWVVGVRSSQRFAVTADTAQVAVLAAVPPIDEESEGDDG
ncbi:MAG: tRNA lysidine(34) synthetase TilS [Anaerolineae bacterium]|jgi:tRNA(Ile)-lysidine synthase